MENERVDKTMLVEGYATVPRWVVRQMDLTSHELAVLIALADRADKENVCWPSHVLLADGAGCSPRTVRRALEKLEKLGLVSWDTRKNERGGNESNLYTLHLDAPKKSALRHPLSTVRPQGPDPMDTVAGPYGHSGRGSNYNEVTTEKYIYMSETSDNNSGEDAKPKRKRRGYSDEFEQFWKIYPRTRDGKFEASKAFAKALTVTDLETILNGAYRYANDPNRSDAYTKMASTWLNKRCWDDGPLPARGSGRRTMSERLRGEYDTLMASSTVSQARQLESGGRW